MAIAVSSEVEIKTKDASYRGILLPSNNDIINIKLKSGYNMGIEKKKIKSIRTLSKPYRQKSKVMGGKKNPKLPNISILHTGGTLASKVDYRTGGVKAQFSPENILSMFPELENIANINTKFVSNMLSEDMRFKHYSLIAKEIEKEVKKGSDGIIIGHGTDTLHYTSSALSFMLDNIPIPVILVGAQRSSDRGSSDAAMNLICAASFIAKTDFSGIAICMHSSIEDKSCFILPPNKTRKLHTSRRDAFKSVNARPIAEVYYNGKIDFFSDYEKKDRKRKLKVLPKLEEKVALVKTHPNMHPNVIESLNKFKGVVIEGTGLGQAPIGTENEISKPNAKIFKAIKKLTDSGAVVVMTSQCIFGSVQMHVYSNAIELSKIGVLPGKDMLSETALVKLAWLLANYKKNEVKELISKNLKGEINEQLSLEFLEE